MTFVVHTPSALSPEDAQIQQERLLLVDHQEGNRRAFQRPRKSRWWHNLKFWQSSNFGCKRYTVVLIGDNAELRAMLCNSITIESAIEDDPMGVDMRGLEHSAQNLKTTQPDVHIEGIEKVYYLPGGRDLQEKFYLRYTLVIYRY